MYGMVGNSCILLVGGRGWWRKWLGKGVVVRVVGGGAASIIWLGLMDQCWGGGAI